MEESTIIGGSDIDVPLQPYKVTYDTGALKQWIKRDGLDSVIKSVTERVSDTIALIYNDLIL